MKQAFFVIATLIAASQSFSQTKLIAHKSHSGTAATFGVSLVEELFGNPGSNFGEFQHRTIMSTRIDSVIFLSDTASILVSSRGHSNSWGDSVKVWERVRDTVENHPLFSRSRGVESIRRSMKDNYSYRISADRVKFISRDTIKKPVYINYERPAKRNVAPLIVHPGNNRKPPFDGGMLALALVFGVICFIAGAGFYSFRKVKSELVG